MQPITLALCNPLKDTERLDWPRYRMEPKLDGFRVQIIIGEAGQIDVYTRTNHNANGKLLAVERGLADVAQSLAGTIFDGEAVYLDEHGLADFNWTARVMGSATPVAQAKQRAERKYLSVMVFDLPFLMGNDIRHMTYNERRHLLTRTTLEVVDSPHVVLIPSAPASIDQHEEYTRTYGEGSVLKLHDGVYKGGRSNHMLKWKKVQTEDVVVMGTTPGQGKYRGLLGAVVFGQYRDGALVQRGQCSGMTDAQRKEFTRLHEAGELEGAVMEIKHNGVLADEGFRHPQFLKMRATNDKKAEDCAWS